MMLASNLPKEFSVPLLLPLKCLHNCGLIQTSRGFAVIFRLLMYSSFFISFIVYGVIAFPKQSINLNELVNMVSVFLMNMQSIMKSIILNSKKKEIIKVIDELGKLWRMNNLTKTQSDRKDIHIRRLKKFKKSFYFLSIFGYWNYVLVPFLLSLFGMFTQGKWEYKLPFSCWFPIDPTSNCITYVFMYVFQVYSIFWMVEVYIGSLIITVTLCALLSIELEHLQDDILNIINIKNREEITSDIDFKLMTFIKRHQALILISEQYSKIFNKIIFLDLFFVRLTICFFGFSGRVTTELQEKLSNYVGVIALTLPIYCMCYYGEMLYHASSAISHSVYHTIWYDKDRKVQRTLLFILMRTQLPCMMPALYAPVTLNTFAKVLSTTWSYFSLINSVYEDNQ